MHEGPRHVSGPAQRPAGHDRHPSGGSRRLLRPSGVDHARPRRPRLARRPVRNRGRPRAADRALARLDLDRPLAARPRVARQRRIRATGRRQEPGRGLPRVGLPDGGLRLGLPSRPPLRLRSRVRNLRRPSAPRQRPSPDALRRAHRRPNDRGRPEMAGCDAGRRRPILPLGALLRSARALRAARGASGAVPLVTLRRGDRVRRRPARAAAASTRRALSTAARPRDRGPRRGPRRTWRGDPRPVRVRRDPAGAVDHGRAGLAFRARGERRGPGHRRRSDLARLRRPPGPPGHRRPLAPGGGRWNGSGRCAGLCRVPVPAAPVWLGPAPRLADGPLQVHRGPAARAVRPRRGRRRNPKPGAGRTRTRRRDASPPPRGHVHQHAQRGERNGRGDGRAPGRPGLPGGRQRARHRGGLARSQGWRPARGAPRPGHGDGSHGTRGGHPRADRGPRRGPEDARGPAHARGRLRRRGPACRGHRRPPPAREGGPPVGRGQHRSRRQPALRRTLRGSDPGARAHGR